MPTVSVIIPTYNRAGLLDQALKSVFAQTYHDYEIIVVDDGSTDDTKHIAEKYGNAVRYVFQQNQGEPAARNQGIRLARGKYIAFLDSDDLFMPRKLETQGRYLDENPHISMVYTSHMRIDEQGRHLKTLYATPASQLKTRPIFTWVIGVPAVMVRRSVLEDVGGFDEKMYIATDLDLWYRIVQRYQVADIHEPLWKLRLHASMTNRDPERYLRMHMYLLNRIYGEKKKPATSLERRTYAIPYLGTGMLALQRPHKAHLALSYIVRSFLYWPFSYKTLLLLTFALADRVVPSLTRRILNVWLEKSYTILR